MNKSLLGVILSLFAFVIYATVNFTLSEATLSDIFSVTSEMSEFSSISAEEKPNLTQNTVSSALGKININTANWQELTELDGIGEVLAKRIVAYREENGAFSEPEELLEVTGIGKKKLKAIMSDITL